MAGEEIRFAGTVIEVDGDVVAKVTSFTRTFDVQEEDVTGAEDVMDGSLILHTKFIPVSVGKPSRQHYRGDLLSASVKLLKMVPRWC